MNSEKQAARMASEVEEVKEFLKEFGFTDIKMEKAPIPAHIVDFFREGSVGNFTDEQIKNAQENGFYQRVTTAQGSFGFVFGPYPFLDLEGTGITIKDLGQDEVDEEDPTSCLGCLGIEDERGVKFFRTLLELKSGLR